MPRTPARRKLDPTLLPAVSEAAPVPRGPATVIPFGKYKGHPVEVLSGDREYCDWLVAQDWFRTRYNSMFTMVVNNFGAPSETPEHNALQARFLEQEWTSRFFWARRKPQCDLFARARDEMASVTKQLATSAAKAVVLEAKQAEYELYVAAARQEYDVEKRAWTDKYGAVYAKWDAGSRSAGGGRLSSAGQPPCPYPPYFSGTQGGVSYELERHKEAHQKLEARLQALTEAVASGTVQVDVSPPKFEERGVDVRLGVTVTLALASGEAVFRAVEPFYDYDAHAASCVMSARVECKPTLGDDYPAVLRQARVNGSDTLVIGQYMGVGATLDQVRKMFAPIVILTVAEIEQTQTIPEGDTAS